MKLLKTGMEHIIRISNISGIILNIDGHQLSDVPFTFWFITILFVNRDKQNQTQVIPTYVVFSFELHNNLNKCTYEKEHAHACMYI
jgi:hypothetical protein